MSNSKYTISLSTMTSLANAVRALTGEIISYTPAQMISEINNHGGGGSYDIVMPMQYMNSTITVANMSNTTKIAARGFENCSLLSQASFPACKMINDNAFADCISLSSISFPACTTIYQYVFSGCNLLSELNFPECVTINDFAFDNCSWITSFSFPKCEYIGASAFRSCKSVTALSFPACSYIGNYAFHYCASLSSLYLDQVTAVPTLVASSAFTGTYLLNNAQGRIYVPESLLSDFKAASVWKTLSNKIVSI